MIESMEIEKISSLEEQSGSFTGVYLVVGDEFCTHLNVRQIIL